MLEKIKEMLGEELTKQVEEKLGDIELGITNDGSLVPAEKHEALKKDLKGLKEELKLANDKMEETSKTLESLKEEGKSAEELKEQLNKIKEEYDGYKNETEERLVNKEKTYALEKALLKSNANPDAVDLLLNKFELEKINLDKEGNIVDWEEHLKPIKETRTTLFGEEKFKGNPPSDNITRTSKLDTLVAQYNEAQKKRDVASMINIQNQIKQIKEN